MNYKLSNPILFYCLICISSIFFLFNPANFPADDGFFYPQIAYNIVNGKGSFFNDLYLTNGYHPLWMVFCCIAELLNPFGKQEVVYILWLFQTVFVIFSLSFLNIFFKNNKEGEIIGFFFIITLYFSLGTLYLTEAHLNLFCFSILIYFLASKINNDWLFGLLFSLVFLSRLDNIFPLFFLSLYYFYYRKYNYLTLFRSGIVIFFICGSYLFSNYLFFGALVPISGRIKSSFPYFQTYIFLTLISQFFLVCNIIALLILFFFKTIQYRNLKIFIAVGSVVQLLYNVVFQSQIGQWYYVIQIIVIVILIGDIVFLVLKKHSKKKWLNYILIVSGIIISCSIGYMKKSSNFSLQFTLLDKNSHISERKENEVKVFSQKIKKTLPANSRIFIYDFPGKFAFYSDMQVIPADGLVGNQNFFSEITNSKFTDYMKRNNIQYLILPSYFHSNNEDYNFIGIKVNRNKYYIKNTLTKKIAGEINLNDFRLIKNFSNPIKIWQKDYDSVSVYKLKTNYDR
ncbi:hypothetical protein [Epilithonimonas sp.]|uniref:hypothetical protein n=1 Tax=Epilithonimonas sp. TaxID=2894511 RepID=UPI0035B067B6